MSTHQRLISQVDFLVSEKAIRCFGDLTLNYESLSENELSQLTALMIEEDDGDLYSIYENERYEDILGSFLRYLKNPTFHSKEEFISTLKLCVMDHYKKKISMLLNERLEEAERNAIAA